jgi:photosystem II stability/assembly factor-like uncharacterized protein
LKCKKQYLILIVVTIFVFILIAVFGILLMSNTQNDANANSNNNDGNTNGSSDLNGDNSNSDGNSQLTGNWVDLSSNINAVAVHNEFEHNDYSDVFFVNENEGWVTSSCVAEIYHTTDGGNTWEVQTTQYLTEAIWMLNKNEGYAGGNQGRIYHTTDGGDNWNTIGGLGATLTDITFYPESSTGFACGFDGAVALISPEGVNRIQSGFYSHTLGVSATGSDEAWFCGGSIISHMFLNGTKDWNSYPSGGYNAISMVSNKEGWIVGDSGIIAHTTDGHNWIEQTNPKMCTFFAVLFLDSNEGWTVGTNGTILHTINGGTTWTVEAEGKTANFLRSVSAPSSDCVYICGNNGTLLKYIGE